MRWAIVSAAIGLLCVSGNSFAQQGTASPNVNPFAPRSNLQPQGSGVTARVGDDAVPTEAERPRFQFPKPTLPKWEMPKLQMPKLNMPKMEMPKIEMPAWAKPQPRMPNEPSTWDKLNQNTKSFFTKTRDTLMPWAAEPAPSAPRSPTGLRRATSTANNNGAEPERRIETATDFLSLPRPQY